MVALAAASTASGAARAAPLKAAVPAVGTIEVHRSPITETSEYVGRIQAIDSVALVPRVTGYLEKRLFDEGSEVKTGDLLYVIEQPPYQAQVDADEAALEQAKAQAANAGYQFERQKSLLATPAGQRSTFDTAQATQRSSAAQVLGAQATLETAQINLGYTEIKAPIDGRITQTSVNPGNVVSPTTGTLATIVSQDPMYVLFPVAARDLYLLNNKYAKVGGINALAIKVRLSTGKLYGQAGKLDYVSPTVSASTDTITLRATIANPRDNVANNGTGDRELINGEFVTVLLQAPQPISLIAIPISAVLTDQQGSYVFTLDQGDVAHRTNIHTGEQSGTDIAVLSGLDDGETLVVTGLQRIHDGSKVNPGPADRPVTGKDSGATATHAAP